MIFPEQTPLSESDVTATQKTLLESLWIESIEEAVAAATALSDSNDILEKSGLDTVLRSERTLDTISPGRLAEVRSARQGGGLGCIVDEQILEDFRRMGRLRPESVTPSGAFEAALPDSLRLIDRMPPVRDQGKRGTCVAFGAVALREFLTECCFDLSEQFLYWACKELDGHPGAGTYIHTAMSALAQYGVCLESVWPYNPVKTNDEGQGPPPGEAMSNAKAFCLDATRTVEPNLVLHYKSILCGGERSPGMPITFGSLVFDSWYKSSETHRTGKITLPLPGESPVGGHAWCIVGYVDDEDVPGGGYFIVRNSWGSGWAAENPEKAGHALMPYEYVERYAHEAFTGPRDLPPVSDSDESGSEWDEYLRVLEKDERDVDGKKLKKDTTVLFNPVRPDEIREDSPSNRQEFLRSGRGWTATARQRVCIPTMSSLSADQITMTEKCRSAKKAFMSAIDENVMSSTNHPIPEVKSLPFWFPMLAWEPKIKSVIVEDLTDELTGRLVGISGVPANTPWPDDWRKLLKRMCGMKVYSIHGMTAIVHVVAAYPSAFSFHTTGQPVVAPSSQEMVDLVCDVYKRWMAENKQHASFTFFTMGSSSPWPETMEGHAASDHWLILCDYSKDGTWDCRTPPRVADRLSLRNFMDRLRPETRQQRISRVKTCVDEYLKAGYEGNIHLEKIAAETGYRRTAVRDAFLAIQELGHYRVYRTHEGDIAVGSADTKMGRVLAAGSFRRSWFSRIACLGPAFSVGIWFMKDWFLGQPFRFWGFASMIPLAYAGEWLNTHFRKWHENKE